MCTIFWYSEICDWKQTLKYVSSSQTFANSGHEFASRDDKGEGRPWGVAHIYINVYIYCN